MPVAVTGSNLAAIDNLIGGIAFGLLSLVPGDATSAILGENASEEAVRAVERDLGLDRSPPRRYGGGWEGLFAGILGDRL